MEKQKKYTIEYNEKDFVKVPTEKVVAFNQRISVVMKEHNREFIKKQKKSEEIASKIILNS